MSATIQNELEKECKNKMEPKNTKLEVKEEELEVDDTKQKIDEKVEKVGGNHPQSFHSRRSSSNGTGDPSKLGFSIAQIMGFMGSKTNVATAAATASTVSQDLETKSNSETEIAIKASSPCSSPLLQDHSRGRQQTLQHQPILAHHQQPPKLWRPQPFREFSASSAPQSQRFVLILNLRRYLLWRK